MKLYKSFLCGNINSSLSNGLTVTIIIGFGKTLFLRLIHIYGRYTLCF